MTGVSFYACSSYEDKDAILRAVRGIFANCDAATLLGGRKRVVIKPNLVTRASPEAAATTHPAVLEAIVEVLREYTDDIALAECPGGLGNEAILEGIYRTTGVAALCERMGVPILKERTAVQRALPEGYATHSLGLLKSIADAPVLLNVGKLKSHALTTFTGCAKNLYGAIPGLSKVEYHARYSDVRVFSDLILDLNRTLCPAISILDAVVGMEGNGPTGGKPRAIGGILGGANAFAVDFLGAKLIGVNPEETPILAAAHARGMLPEDIRFLGDDYKPYVKSDFLLADAQRFSILRSLPDVFSGRLKRFLEPRPVISTRCIGCGECAAVCPGKAITLSYEGTHKRAYIHKKQCIRCYCCQELCPKKAVDVRKNPLLKL